MGDLRWAKASANERSKGYAEQYYADADGGRYTVKRISRTERWEAYFVSRIGKFSMGFTSDKDTATEWCATRGQGSIA